MKIYLRAINPVVSVLVLLLCLWAAMNGDDGFKPMGMLKGGIPNLFRCEGFVLQFSAFLDRQDPVADV